MVDYQTYQADWQGIALSVSFCPSWAAGYCHVEVRSPCPLPITETGYRSHFDHPETIEAAGGPIAFVLAWLNSEAATPEWDAQVEKARQLTLF